MIRSAESLLSKSPAFVPGFFCRHLAASGGLCTLVHQRQFWFRRAVPSRASESIVAPTPMQLLLPGLRDAPTCEAELIGVALGLGARNVPGWSNEEEKLARDVVADSGDRLLDFRARIEQGKDPLGDAYCRLRPPAQRRTTGATYTPRPIVRAMVDWAAKYASPARVVDPGAGSGRYLLAAGRRFPRASLIGIEIDPLAAILLRANLCAAGLADRADIVVGDFRDHCMPRIDGRTLFIGNPPDRKSVV